jgi:hypothetical protein
VQSRASWCSFFELCNEAAIVSWAHNGCWSPFWLWLHMRMHHSKIFWANRISKVRKQTNLAIAIPRCALTTWFHVESLHVFHDVRHSK